MDLSTQGNQSKFFFRVPSLPDFFQVINFEGREALSECFRFQVKVITSETSIEYEELVGKPAYLSLKTDEESCFHHGIILDYEQIPAGENKSVLILTLVPEFYKLQYSKNNRVFQNLNVIDIVKKVLTDHSIPQNELVVETTGNYPPLEFVIQYNETDLNFIQRLLETAGLFYAFDNSESDHALVLSDKSTSREYNPIHPEVLFQIKDGLVKNENHTIHYLSKKNFLHTASESYKDYNYTQPAADVYGNEEGEGIGKNFTYGENIKTAEQATQVSKIRNEFNQQTKILVSGESDCQAFTCGKKVKITDRTGSNLGGEYFLTEVLHQGDQEASILGQGKDPGYTNTFKGIPANQIFRPARRTPKPVVPGVIPVKVDGPEGEYAFIDEEGRYRVKFPFDLESTNSGEASLPIRMTQPYTGDNYGIHFPLHTGTEVMVGFENGDIDRPIGLGSPSNPLNLSPVSNKNKSESVTRTASGNQLIFDDLKDETSIKLKTSGEHVADFTDKEDSKAIHFKTSGAKEIKLNDTDENITIQTQESSKSIVLDHKNENLSIKTVYGHEITLNDTAKSISLLTKKSHSIVIDDDKDFISITDGKGKNFIKIDIGANKITLTSNGDIDITAKKDFNLVAANVNILANSGKVNIEGKQDVNVKGMNVNIDAKQKINLKSKMDTLVDAGMNLKLSGKMNVESKAGMAHNSKGLMIKAEASAIHTIKGAMVMIN